MKKIIFISILLWGILVFTGCGKNELSIHAGTYKMDYMKYVDEDVKNTNIEEEIVLYANGKGKSNRGDISYDITWSLDGENIIINEETKLSINKYTGIIKDGKLDIYDGDANNSLTLERVYNKQ